MRSLHCNRRSDAEDEARLDLYAEFEAALDELIARAREEADEVGGYFRGPGIKAGLDKILRSKSVK